MEENQANSITNIYNNDIMKLKEIDIYKNDININNEIFNNRTKKINYIKLCLENLLKSNNILKNYSLLTYIHKKFGIENELVPKIKDIYNVFQKDFNSYIEKLKKIKNQESLNGRIIIDDILHEINMDIRIKFLELICKDMRDNRDVIEYLKNNVLLSQKIFDIEDKKNILNFIFNINKNQKEILNELLLKIEKDNTNVFKDINDVLFYEFLFLELNYIENTLQYKEKLDENIKKIRYEIISINKNLENLNHFKNYIGLFYIQKDRDCINEMSNFLFKLYNYKNKIEELCLLNQNYLIEKLNPNALKLYIYIIKNVETDYISTEKSHNNLCKRRIIRINIEKGENNIASFHFYGNTKINEIQDFLNKKYPDDYFEFKLKKHNENEELNLNISDLNKTLNELTIQKIQLKIKKKEIMKAKLLENGKLTAKFNNILESCFKEFSKNKENMNENDAAEFLSKMTKKPYTKKSIKTLDFLKNANAKNNELNKANFINFYKKNLEEEEAISNVWENIKNMDYYPDLNKIGKIEMPKEKDNFKLRFKLSNAIPEKKNEKNNLFLFDHLLKKNKQSLNKNIFYFILLLSTNIEYYNNILENFNNERYAKLSDKIDDYIENMYNLIIIESIFEDINIKELKEDGKYKDIEISSEIYLPFESEKIINTKKRFIIDFLNNNYYKLIDYVTSLLQKMNDKKNEVEKIDIIISCCLKGLEIINNIYGAYFKINFENDEKNELMLRAPLKLIKENNLQKIIEDQEKYINLIDQILKFITNYNNLNKTNNELLLIQNCYYLLFSFLYANKSNKNISDHIYNNRENISLLSSIIKNIINVGKNPENKDYIKQFLYFKNKENISPYLLTFIIKVTFSMLDDEVNKIELNQDFFDYFNNLCSNAIKYNYDLIKTQFINLHTKVYNYIKLKNINKVNNKDDLYSNYLLLLYKSLDKLTNDNDNIIKQNIINYKFNNKETLFDFIINYFLGEEEKIIERKKNEYSNLEKLLNKDQLNEFVSYDEIMSIKNSKEKLKNENNDKDKKLVNEMIAYCSWYLSLKNNFSHFYQIIQSLEKMKKKDSENIDIFKIIDKKRIKRRNEFVGLKNMGNTCYLNSVIQQLFMIPTFKYSILNTNDKKPKNPKESLDDDNILHQLQKMFTFLLFSYYGEFSPKDFISSIKDQNQQMVITNCQQDAQEFYSNFCDKIEESLKNTAQKDLIKDLFIGKFCYMNKCPCGNLRFRFDEFKSITLEVRNIDNINESLNQYIAEEKIEDYTCQNCQKKVTLSNRTLLTELPNILIIHLNRLIMNFSDNQIEKINSRFEFPKKLNLKNYCIENILNENEIEKTNKEIEKKNEIYKKKDEYYEYELKGITIHKGNADGGHYVSIIKIINEKSKENNDEDNEDIWYEFDDSKVKKFDIHNLEKECFGGVNEETNKETHKSAYLLFYELSKKKPLKIQLLDAQNKDKVINLNKDNYEEIEKEYNITKLDNHISEKDLFDKEFFNNDNYVHYKYIPYNKIQKNIFKEYLQDVIEDNKTYNYLYGDDKIISFSNYLLQIIILFIETVSLNNYNIVFNTYKVLLDIIFSAIISSLFQDNYDEYKIKNIVILLEKLIIPLVEDVNKNKFNEQQKSELIGLINYNLFNNHILKLVFTDNNLKDIQKQILKLLKLIINVNDDENNEKLFVTIYKVVNEENNLSTHLYEVLNEFIRKKNSNLKINTKSEIFMLLFYKLYKENNENLKIIYEIYKYLIYKDKILEEDEKILKEIKTQFNDRLMKILFENNIDILILLIKQLQYNDQKFSDEFNINYIQKLYTHCEKLQTKEFKIKLIKFIYGILEIIDNFTEKRIELLLGYPSLIIKKNPNNIIPLFGVATMNNNINTELFEYISFNHITKERCILALLFPSSSHEVNNNWHLEEKERLDLIYELIKVSLGVNENSEGNYFLFKFIYLMQPRSIKYQNLYQEIKELLEKKNYDLTKIKINEQKCIDTINFETEQLEELIYLSKRKNYNDKKRKYSLRPNLPNCFKTSNTLLNNKKNREYYTIVNNIIPDEIGKIVIDLIASSENLSIIRFEYFTTYFKRKELISFSEENRDFNYQDVRRDKVYESQRSMGNENIIWDYSTLKEKKDEKEFIFDIDRNLAENKDIIIINKEVLGKKEIKSCLIRYFLLSKIKSAVVKIKIIKSEMTKDIENNFYLPEILYDSVEKNEFNKILSISRLTYEFDFLEKNSIGTSFSNINHDKYFNDYIK